MVGLIAGTVDNQRSFKRRKFCPPAFNLSISIDTPTNHYASIVGDIPCREQLLPSREIEPVIILKDVLQTAHPTLLSPDESLCIKIHNTSHRNGTHGPGLSDNDRSITRYRPCPSPLLKLIKRLNLPVFPAHRDLISLSVHAHSNHDTAIVRHTIRLAFAKGRLQHSQPDHRAVLPDKCLLYRDIYRAFTDNNRPIGGDTMRFAFKIGIKIGISPGEMTKALNRPAFDTHCLKANLRIIAHSVFLSHRPSDHHFPVLGDRMNFF